MSAYDQLFRALEKRETQTGKFIFHLMDEIDKIIVSLLSCDTSNSSPEVSDSVNLSIQELQKLIERIKDDSNIDKNVTDSIAEAFSRKTTNLRRIEPPSFWNRLFGPSVKPAVKPAVVQPTASENRSLWESWVRKGHVPDNTPLPNATRVYQAEPIPYAEASYTNPYAPSKGGRRTRKSRRRV